MITILIAEDEEIFREYIKTVINWADYGFEIIGEAKNGLEAFELTIEKKPDLILIDISMPKMDGLTFIEKCKENNVNSKYILITGHSEFQYAKKALKIGVSDYILKPFDSSELLKSILALKKIILESKINMKNLEKYEKILINYYFNELISDSIDVNKDIIIENINKYISSDFKFFQIAVIEKDFLTENWQTLGQKNLWKYAICNIVDELFTKKHFNFYSSNDCVVCFITQDEYADNTSIFERITNISKDSMDFSVTIALSKTFTCIKDANYYYDKCLKLLECKFLLGCGKVISEKSQKLQTFGYNIYYDSKIFEAIRSGNENEVCKKLTHIFETLKKQNVILDTAYIIGINIVSEILNQIIEIGLTILEVFGDDFMPFTKIKNCNNIESIKTIVFEIYNQSMSYLKSKKFTRTESLTKFALSYIEENYSNEDLQVSSIAKSLHINSGYLRTLFKKEMNITISNYIFNLRLEKAKELISKSNFKLYEVSIMVGYSDPAYFSKCFKKRFGISPSEFYNIKIDSSF